MNINKQQTPIKYNYCKTLMDVADNQHVEEHGSHGDHDDCDDCKQQKMENQSLIMCYQKLSKINSKVKKMKSSISSHAEQSNSNKKTVINWNQRLSLSPRYQSANYDIKSMGYQLASLLLQKKTKIQIQNKKLHSLIKAMQKEKQQANIQFSQISISTRFQRGNSQDNNNRYMFRHSLNRANNSQQYQTDTEIDRNNFEMDRIGSRNQRGMRTGSVIIDSTYSSLFQTPKQHNPQSPIKKNNAEQLKGLNLWLYQGNLSKEEDLLFSNKGTVSTRKSNIQKKNNKRY